MSNETDSPRRLEVVTALVVLGIFLAGAAVGAGVYHWARPHRPPPPHHRGPPRHPWPFDDLELSASQDQKVREISERFRPELEAVVKETYPKVRAVNDRMELELRTVLTPEQQRRLDEFKTRRPPHGAPPGPPPPGGPPGPPPPF